MYVCTSVCLHVGTNACRCTLACMCAYMCGHLRLMSGVFFNHSLPYILRQGHLLNPYLANFSTSSHLPCHGRVRLPSGRSTSVLPCPPDFYLGAEDLNAVPCACATSILFTDPSPWLS